MSKNNKVISILLKVGCMANGVLAVISGIVFIVMVGLASMIEDLENYSDLSEMLDQADSVFGHMHVWTYLFYGTMIIAGVLAFLFLLFNLLKKEETIFGWIEFVLQMIVVAFGIVMIHFVSLIQQISRIGSELIFSVDDSSLEVWEQSHQLTKLTAELENAGVYVGIYFVMLFVICVAAAVALVFLILSLIKKDPQSIQEQPGVSMPIPSKDEALPKLPEEDDLPDLPNTK